MGFPSYSTDINDAKSFEEMAAMEEAAEVKTEGEAETSPETEPDTK